MAQHLIVAIIVTGCALYAAWVLMPAAARRGLVRGLLAGPIPASLARTLEPYATAPTGCACDGCDRAAPAASKGSAQAADGSLTAGVVKPITFHRQRRR